MENIDKIIEKLCISGAKAMQRYAQVALEEPDGLPEFFLQGFILNELGEGLRITLERRFFTVWSEFNKNTDRPALSAARAANPKIDMVLYDEHTPLALIEFKRISWERDYPRVMEFLRYLPQCRYGVVCGCICGQSGYDFHRREANEHGDRWIEERMPTVEGLTDPYWFCARLFENPASQ